MSSSHAGNPDRTCLLILGMHRSGTSALARSLSLLGCTLPGTLMPASRSNRLGHWESTAIRAFNEALLEEAGSSWDDWRPVDSGQFTPERRAALTDQMAALAQKEFADARLFVLKDPRICRLAPLWLDALRTQAIKVLPVISWRHPGEVAASLQARNGMDPAYGELVWLRHVLDAEAATRGYPRAVIGYDDLLSGGLAALDRLAARLGLVWPDDSPAARSAITAFLSEGERHHRALPPHGPASSQAVRVLEQWSRDGEEAGGHDTLDTLRQSFGAAEPYLLPLSQAYRRTQADLEQMTRRWKKVRRQRDEALAGQ